MMDARDKSPLLPIGGKSPITASSSRLFCLHMTIAILCFFCFSLIAAFVVTSKTRCHIVIPLVTTTDNTIYNTTTSTKTTTLSFVPLDPLALPSVAIIGTPKGGTTDLQNQIISTWSNIMIRPVTKELRDLADWDGISTLIGSLNHRMYAERLNHPCATAINSTTGSFIQCSSNNRGIYTIDADPSYLENPAIPIPAIHYRTIKKSAIYTYTTVLPSFNRPDQVHESAHLIFSLLTIPLPHLSLLSSSYTHKLACNGW
jgi:hypothetical protein